MDNPDKLPSDAADESGLDPGEAARMRALEDGSGFSPFLARAAVSGASAETGSRTGLPPEAFPVRGETGRRRGGRPANPGTDRDFEPIPEFVPPNDAEIAARQDTTRSGMQQVARQMGVHNFERDVAEAARLGISVEAATRLRLEQQDRRRKERS